MLTRMLNAYGRYFFFFKHLFKVKFFMESAQGRARLLLFKLWSMSNKIDLMTNCYFLIIDCRPNSEPYVKLTS